jgi:hypothetical protein
MLHARYVAEIPVDALKNERGIVATHGLGTDQCRHGHL